MCQICGQPDNVRCNCQVSQPFCDQCGNDNDCVEKIDAQCVFFHLNCTDPAGLPNLGIPCNTDLETILEALDDLVGNHFNIPFQGQETSTIRWVANGPAGHKPYAHVKISEDDGNIIEERPDGIFALEPIIPEPEPIEFVNETNDCITITATQDEEGRYHLTPSLDILCLINKIREEHLVEFCALIDDCECLLTIENLVATFAAACPPGYVLNEAETLCVSEETIAPTIEETPVEACENQYEQYGQYGALVYVGGFNANGEGASGHVLGGLVTDLGSGDVVPINTPGVWQNNLNVENNYGPVNRAGVWRCAGTGGSFGFVVPINVPVTKTYYLGIAADDEFQVTVNGTTIIDTAPINNNYWFADGGAMYRFWHIYPVNLTAGINYVGFIGVDTGGVESILAAEIYDNTLVELQAAALDPTFVADPTTFPLTQNHYTNLNLVFSTRCARQPGTVFTIGNATCPDNTWDLDTTGGDPLVPPCQGINSDPADWICRRETFAPFSGYTATLVWDRIPTAIEYEVQQKLTGDPDINYVAAVGSPVANPVSGTTVTLIIGGLSSSDMTFRVRAVFDDCETEWTVVDGTPPPCTAVSFTESAELPPATDGSPYTHEITLSGTGPFTLSGITKPAWMNIQIIGSTVLITGTPDTEGEVDVIFTVENCTEDEQTYNGSIDVLPAGDFALKVTLSNSSSIACAGGATLVYWSGTFTPETTIFYTDPAMTIPVSGFDFVLFGENIYNIDDTTGEVGTLFGPCV